MAERKKCARVDDFMSQPMTFCEIRFGSEPTFDTLFKFKGCKMKKSALATMLLALALPIAALAAETVTIGVDSENPPFMSSKDGKAVGLYPAILTAAFAAMGDTAQIEAKPWKRCIADTDAGTAGTGGIYKNDERLKKYDFSEQIFVEKMAVYFNKSHPVSFSSVTDLMGKRVGVVRGWSYGDDFDKAAKEGKITTEEVTSDAQNFQKLAAGRVDVVLAIEEAGNSQLKAGKMTGLERAPAYLFQNPTYLAFNKSSKKTELLAKFNKAIADMKKSAKLDSIAGTELTR